MGEWFHPNRLIRVRFILINLDFQRFLQLKAVEGDPEPGGVNQYNKEEETESNSSKLTELAEKIGWSETIIKMANWLDKNAPEEKQVGLPSDPPACSRGKHTTGRPHGDGYLRPRLRTSWPLRENQNIFMVNILIIH